MINKVYVVCRDDGTGIPYGVYMSIHDAMFETSNFNPDIAEFFIGSSKPNWVRSRIDLVENFLKSGGSK